MAKPEDIRQASQRDPISQRKNIYKHLTLGFQTIVADQGPWVTIEIPIILFASDFKNVPLKKRIAMIIKQMPPNLPPWCFP